MSKPAYDPFITLELLRYYHGKSIAEIKELIKNNEEVAVSETAPTEDGAKLWINTSETTTLNVPEINDNAVSISDTWSSEKISNHVVTEIETTIEERLITKEDIDEMFKEAKT